MNHNTGVTMFRCSALVLSMFMFMCLGSPHAFAFGGMAAMAPGQTSNVRSMRNIDESFLHGKKIVSNRDKSVGKIALCLTTNNETAKLTRKTLKPYTGVTTNAFINSIHECDKPETPIIERLGVADTADVVYYFNKRYKLKLTEHSASAIAGHPHYEK